MVVFPVPHRTTVRVAVGPAALVVRALPDRGSIVRGWERVLDRGMRTELPEPLQHEVDAARVDLLLAPPSAAAFAALEAWGFDDEAIATWNRLGLRARRAAGRGHAGGVLGETRAALLHESASMITLFPGFRTAWLGSHLAVHDAPVRGGHCSFALRWHGGRPALLWDVPAGTRLRTPVLDPAFESTGRVGETLFARAADRAPRDGGARNVGRRAD